MPAMTGLTLHYLRVFVYGYVYTWSLWRIPALSK
jgi:hypothetical protein